MNFVVQLLVSGLDLALDHSDKLLAPVLGELDQLLPVAGEVHAQVFYLRWDLYPRLACHSFERVLVTQDLYFLLVED